jgi:hypothetical protein
LFFIATPVIQAATSVKLPEGRLQLHNTVMLKNLLEYRGHWLSRWALSVTFREDMLSV